MTLTYRQCLDAFHSGFTWDPVGQRRIAVNSTEACRIRKIVLAILAKRVKQCVDDQKNITRQICVHQLPMGCSITRKEIIMKHVDTPSTDWKILECGGGGDCFFHVVATATSTSMNEVRRWVSECVNDANVDEILSYYTNVYKVGSWCRKSITDLSDIKARIHALQKVIQTKGPMYQGDDTTMKLLLQHPEHNDIGFVVLQSNGTVYPQCFLSKHTKRLVVLYHCRSHWQLVARDLSPILQWQLTFDPFGDLPEFLQDCFKSIDVDIKSDFGVWTPRLELENTVSNLK
jgi:hypothetical protein